MPGGLPLLKPPYGRIVAIDMNSGDHLWMQANGPGPRNHPAIADLDLPWLGQRGRPAPLLTKSLLFLGEGTEDALSILPIAGGKAFRAWDKQTGDVVWECGGMTTNAIPTPIVRDGIAYITSGFRGAAFVAIDLASAEGDVTGGDAILWERDRDTPYVPSPLLVDDRLYLVKNGGLATCLDARSGAVHYEQRLDSRGPHYASPVFGDGRIYVASARGRVTVFAAGRELEILGQTDFDERILATPALADGVLFLRTETRLFAFGGPR